MAALWHGYDEAQRGWQRVRILQSLAKVAVAQAQVQQDAAHQVVLDSVRTRQAVSQRVKWRLPRSAP
jgi:hypothetical protein